MLSKNPLLFEEVIRFITIGIYPWSTPGEGVRKMCYKEKTLKIVEKLLNDLNSDSSEKSKEYNALICKTNDNRRLDDFWYKIFREVLINIKDYLDFTELKYCNLDDLFEDLSEIELFSDIYYEDLISWAKDYEKIDYIEEAMTFRHFKNFYELLEYAQSLEIYEIFYFVLERLKEIVKEEES